MPDSLIYARLHSTIVHILQRALLSLGCFSSDLIDKATTMDRERLADRELDAATLVTVAASVI